MAISLEEARKKYLHNTYFMWEHRSGFCTCIPYDKIVFCEEVLNQDKEKALVIQMIDQHQFIISGQTMEMFMEKYFEWLMRRNPCHG